MKRITAAAVALLWAGAAWADPVPTPGPVVAPAPAGTACTGPGCGGGSCGPCAGCGGCGTCGDCGKGCWAKFCDWICYRPGCYRDPCVVPVKPPPLFAYFECADGCRDHCPPGDCCSGIARIGQPIPPGNSPPPAVAGEHVSIRPAVPHKITGTAVVAAPAKPTIVQAGATRPAAPPAPAVRPAPAAKPVFVTPAEVMAAKAAPAPAAPAATGFMPGPVKSAPAVVSTPARPAVLPEVKPAATPPTFVVKPMTAGGPQPKWRSPMFGAKPAEMVIERVYTTERPPPGAVMLPPGATPPVPPAVQASTSLKPAADAAAPRVVPVADPKKKADAPVPISPYGNYPYLYPSTYSPPAK